MMNEIDYLNLMCWTSYLHCHSHRNHHCLSVYKRRVLIPSACLLNVVLIPGIVSSPAAVSGTEHC
jgi:hypothetical protein